MKIVLLTTYYGPFLRNFYEENAKRTFNSFEDHLNELLAKFFGDSGSTWYHLRQAGHDCFLIISNCEALQKQWAAENGVTYNESNWEKEIALAQIRHHRPDVFYNEGVFQFFGDFTRTASAYCKKIAAWMSTPFSPTLDLDGISLILSSTPAFVDQFRKSGLKSEYLLPAFDVRVLEKFSPNEEKSIPFSFVGGWSHVHIRRKEAVRELVKRTPVQIWGYGYKSNPGRRSLRYYKNIILPENRNILKRYHGEAWGLDMYGILHQSLMTFNIHESLLQGLVGNMRMFEATGMGTMMLNEDAPNLADIFIPGKEVETYRSVAEAAEKVKYYMAHPLKAIEIGKNAQLRTCTEYNYTRFTEKLAAHFESILKS